MSIKTCWFTWRSAADGSYQECALAYGHQDTYHENADQTSCTTDPMPPWGPWGKGWPDQDPDTL